MKKALALILAGAMSLSLAACGSSSGSSDTETGDTTASDEESSGSAMTEEEAWEAAQAGTLESDASTGYEYSEETEMWYYSNYPNYKDFNGDGVVKVAYVCKFSGSWFTPKEEAIEAVCEEYGYEFTFIDANSDEQSFLDGVQNVINQEYDIVVLTPVNTTLLPDAITMLQEAGIAYLTTDDSGTDNTGFGVPHYGIEDYGMFYSLGEGVADDLEEKGFFDDVEEDYSNFLFVLLDSPAVESVHNRCEGFYDAILEAYPEIPEDRVVWLDCGDGLADEILDKFSSSLQANIDTVDKWIVASGGCTAVTPAVTLFREVDADFDNIIIADGYTTAEQMETAMQDDVIDSCYGAGVAAALSGTGVGNVIADLVENGTPIPAFTGLDAVFVTDENIDEFYTTYYAE